MVIAGLQEGLWPNTTPRGGVLGTQHLVDVLDGVAGENAATGVSSRAPLLAEERRLLIAAMGRARSRLLVTAVDSESGDESMLPSPFYHELGQLATDSETQTAEPVLAPRVLAPAPLVGRLRAVVCAPEDAVGDAVPSLCRSAIGTAGCGRRARRRSQAVVWHDPAEHRRTAVVGRTTTW